MHSNQMGDYRALSRKNRQIAEEASELLTTVGDSADRWKTLIKKVFKRMRDEMIHSFAVEFREEVPGIIQDAYTQYTLALQRPFEILMGHYKQEVYFDLEIKDMDEITAQHQEWVKKEVCTLYKQKCARWDSYLDESGRGVLVYLSELLQFDLSPLKSDRWG